MASKHTAGYQLSQWEKTDKVIMEDFNADNRKVDSALAGQAEAIAGLTAALAKKGNCRVETRAVTTGVSHSREVPLVIQFSAVPAFFILFDGRSVAFGLGGAKSAVVVVNGQYNAGMTSLSITWSGSEATITNPDYASAYTQYQIAAFYVQ